MEHSDYTARHIEYNYASIDDKHYFGGFFNLAQNNIESVFTAFKIRFGLKGVSPNDLINEVFKEDLSITEYEKGVAFLEQYFPVIHYLYLPVTDDKFKSTLNNKKETERRAFFTKSLKQLISLIDKLRNFYTHHYHKPIDIYTETMELIDNVFLNVITDIKKHKMKSDKSRHLLKKGLLNELEQLERLKTDDLRELKKQGKRVNINDKEAIRNAILNDSFYHLLYKKGINRNYSSMPKDTVNTENGISISESGTLFLLGMFLTRKQSEDLRSRIKGFKAKLIVNPEKPIDKKNNSLKYMATHWVFGHLGFKGLKNRFTTTFTKDTLLAQIIDELSKVPDALYQVFDDKYKDEFIEDNNEYIKTGNKLEQLNDAIVIHPIIRKRYNDRFNYLALRFLDEFAGFPSLRFQVYLGDYLHDKREKKIEGTPYVSERVVKEKIKVFKNLSEASSLKANFFSQSDKITDTGWELFPNPSYNFVGNNIPIRIEIKGKSFSPEANRAVALLKNMKENYKKNSELEYKPRQENKVSIGKILEEMGVEKQAPHAMLSLNELPALLYEVLVNNKSGKEIESIIAEKIAERHKTLTDFKIGEELPKGQVTKNLLKASQHEKINTEKLMNAFKREHETTEAKLSLIEQNQKELRNRKHKRQYIFTNKELGKEATWLADDLKRFMPIQSREKWRGHHHSQLQQSLAYFNTNKNEAFSLLDSFWDFEDETFSWNLGIKTALKERLFDKMYRKYLENRKETLENFIKQLQGFKKDKKHLESFVEQQHIWNLFYKRLYVIDTIEKQVKKLLVKPMQFPRGIFDKKPTYIKGKNIEESPECFADWYVYWNSNDDYQQFYHWDRNYKKAYQDGEMKKTFKRFTRIQGNKIKKEQIQDVFLVKMASKIFNELYGVQDETVYDFKLSAIYKTQKQRREEERKALRQSQKEAGDKSDAMIKSSSAWTITVPYRYENVFEPAVKVKELGKFKRFLTDQKVEKLWGYFPEKIWSKLELEQVLELMPDSYEVIRRDHLLKEIQEFEKYILQSCSFLKEKEPPNFKEYIVSYLQKHQLAKENELTWLIKRTEDDFYCTPNSSLEEKSVITQKAFLLIVVRNMFAHNKLPEKRYYDKIYSLITIEEEASVSNIYLKFVKQTITELKNK